MSRRYLKVPIDTSYRMTLSSSTSLYIHDFHPAPLPTQSNFPFLLSRSWPRASTCDVAAENKDTPRFPVPVLWDLSYFSDRYMRKDTRDVR